MTRSTLLQKLPSLLGGGLFIAATLIFATIADEVREGDTQRYDEAILNAIRQTTTQFNDALFSAITVLGDATTIIFISAVLVGYLLTKQRPRQALFAAIAMGGISILILTLKLLYARPRPDLWEQLVTETSFSFPSGHATASSALALVIAILCWPTRWRRLALLLSTVYIILIGYSRMYLGVHYPTDIIAGWAVSIVWLSIVRLVLRSPKL